LRTLLQAYSQTGQLAEAGTMAAKLFSVHNDVDALVRYAQALIAAGRFEDALQVYAQYSDRLLASDQEKAVESLHALIGHVRGNTAALETLVELLNKAGETTHLAELYELLGHASVQAGELEKARGYYLKLTQLEPQNNLHARNYQQVNARLGQGSASESLITIEEGTDLVDELEASAPFIDQRYPDEVALIVRAALTDAELFVSYNMPEKAMAPLLAAQPRAMRDLRLNQRLAALHTRAGRFAEAAICCRTLESLYHDAGYPDEATRYGELATKYENRASAGAAPTPINIEIQARPELRVETSQDSGSTAESIATSSAPASAEPVPSMPRAAGLFWHAPSAPAASVASATSVKVETAAPATTVAGEGEVDISAEWEDTLTVEMPPTAAPAQALKTVGPAVASPNAWNADSGQAIADTIAEMRFYLKHSMQEQARAAFDKLWALKPGAATLSEMEAELAAAVATSPAVEDIAIEEIEVVPDVENVAIPAIAAPSLGKFQIPPPAPQLAPSAAAQNSLQPQASSPLGDFVSDLESSLGDSFLPAAVPAAHTPQPRPEPMPPRLPGVAITQVGIAAGAAASASAAPSASFSPVQASAPIPSAFTYETRPVIAPPVASAPEAPLGIDLSDMFGELRQELEDEVPAVGEDCETHYNLGVAFREMGLVDEAIGELQKVCQAVDRGQPFSQLMQTYTWLAQCFLDKGVPEAAIRWYERALQIPNLDGETHTALHYELAGAHEAAQNKPAALKHFMEVYGSNIDYRDVSERIKALKS
jgi:tetratricopeptide (TPR) repeat protein